MKNEQTMFQKLKQVGMTYIIWRWMWLMLSSALLLMLGSALSSFDRHGATLFPGIFSIGMPIIIGMQWFVSVAKWQFADPRARLIPGYTRPHFLVIFVVLATFCIGNPLLQAFCVGIAPLGHLAFALLVGGSFLYSMHSDRGTLAIPGVVVLLSGLYPKTSPFWFSGAGDFQAIHVAGIFFGVSLFVWWLWKLATLHEEDEGYFVMPLGAPGSLSRLERVLQGRLQGRKAARGGLGYQLSDRWHNRLFTLSGNPSSAALSPYGWGLLSHGHRAALIGGGFALYGLSLSCLSIWLNRPFAALPGVIAPAIAAFAGPAVGAAISLRSRRVRMAPELLRPASRAAYFDGLFGSLAKLMLSLWLTMSIGLLVIVMTSPITIIRVNFTQITLGYLLLSLAVQLPAFALGLRMAQWQSTVLFALGCYVLAIAEFGLLVFWVNIQKEAGPIPAAAFAAALLIALGVPSLIGARRAWLRAELG